jgi:hypothetical protein
MRECFKRRQRVLPLNVKRKRRIVGVRTRGELEKNRWLGRERRSLKLYSRLLTPKPSRVLNYQRTPLHDRVEIMTKTKTMSVSPFSKRFMVDSLKGGGGKIKSSLQKHAGLGKSAVFALKTSTPIKQYGLSNGKSLIVILVESH